MDIIMISIDQHKGQSRLPKQEYTSGLRCILWLHIPSMLPCLISVIVGQCSEGSFATCMITKTMDILDPPSPPVHRKSSGPGQSSCHLSISPPPPLEGVSRWSHWSPYGDIGQVKVKSIFRRSSLSLTYNQKCLSTVSSSTTVERSLRLDSGHGRFLKKSRRVRSSRLLK